MTTNKIARVNEIGKENRQGTKYDRELKEQVKRLPQDERIVSDLSGNSSFIHFLCTMHTFFSWTCAKSHRTTSAYNRTLAHLITPKGSKIRKVIDIAMDFADERAEARIAKAPILMQNSFDQRHTLREAVAKQKVEELKSIGTKAIIYENVQRKMAGQPIVDIETITDDELIVLGEQIKAQEKMTQDAEVKQSMDSKGSKVLNNVAMTGIGYMMGKSSAKFDNLTRRSI